MSLDDLDEGMRLIAQAPEDAYFVGPRSEEAVLKVERLLGGQFPLTYRKFVREFGAGGFRGFEVYGVVSDGSNEGGVPSAAWITLDERRASALPADLLIIGTGGEGEYLCLKMNDERSSVVSYIPGVEAERQRYEEIAADFGSYFLNEVKARA